MGDQLVQFRGELEEATIAMKKEQNRKEHLLDSFSKKYSEHIIFKKVWKVLEENRRERQEARELDRKMDLLYHKNLKKKAFFPWRTYLLSHPDSPTRKATRTRSAGRQSVT